MSAIGTKRTSIVALHMSAFGAKADIAHSICLIAGLFQLNGFAIDN